MLGRYTTLVGRIMAAVALFTILTGASEEYGGVIVHVDLQRYEHPVPDGYDSWDDVIPDARTGQRYYWAPGEMVLVQRTDGSFVEARNKFAHAGYMSRVSILKSRTGQWFVTDVERRGAAEPLGEPLWEEPPTDDLLIAQKPPALDEPTEGLYTLDSPDGEEIVIEGDGHVATPSTWGSNPGYEMVGILETD